MRISGEFEAVDGACGCRSDLPLMCFDETARSSVRRTTVACRVRGAPHVAPKARPRPEGSGSSGAPDSTSSRTPGLCEIGVAGRSPPTTVLLPRPRNRSLVSRSSNALTSTRLWRWPPATRAPEGPNGRDRGPPGVQRRDRRVRRSLRAARSRLSTCLLGGGQRTDHPVMADPRAKRREALIHP